MESTQPANKSNRTVGLNPNDVRSLVRQFASMINNMPTKKHRQEMLHTLRQNYPTIYRQVLSEYNRVANQVDNNT